MRGHDLKVFMTHGDDAWQEAHEDWRDSRGPWGKGCGEGKGKDTSVEYLRQRCTCRREVVGCWGLLPRHLMLYVR